MPRDLFGDVTDPSITLGTRKWYSVPLSFLVHTFAIGVLVVAPLVATGALPAPNTRTFFMAVEPPPLPQPPPVRRAATELPRRADQNAAPVVAPDSIAPEPDLPPVLDDPIGAELGVPGGSPIEGDAVVAPPPATIERAPDTVVRVGGNVRPPQRVNYVAPSYPALALTARVHGLVILEATIDRDGRVQAARVLRSDSPLLNDAALAAVRQWVYRPTLLNGVPVSVVMTVTVQFQLQ